MLASTISSSYCLASERIVSALAFVIISSRIVVAIAHTSRTFMVDLFYQNYRDALKAT
jgi:hypothetical protein